MRRKQIRPPSSYDVGYRKPPEEYRFKSGQSGNPRGRPKKTHSAQESFHEALLKTVTLKENGISRRVTHLNLIFLSQVRAAAKGDRDAVKHVMSLVAIYGDPPVKSGHEFPMTKEEFTALVKSLHDSV